MRTVLTPALLATAWVMLAATATAALYHYEPLTADDRPIRYLLNSNDQGHNDGTVLGYYQNLDGSYGGFRATLIPKPASLSLLVVAVSNLSLSSRGRL